MYPRLALKTWASCVHLCVVIGCVYNRSRFLLPFPMRCFSTRGLGASETESLAWDTEGPLYIQRIACEAKGQQ